MCLQNPSQELLESEKQVQLDINTAIDNFENLIFNAGAGAGKTHALIESLKHLVKKHGDRLKTHNQNIICITYTNVATNEIKERLGNSELVKVSTIHERLWELIEPYQKQLVEIHKENVENLLSKKSDELNENSLFTGLREDEQTSFKTVMISNRDAFRTNRDKPAQAFRSAMNEFLDGFTNILSSVGNFKKLVSIIYKIVDFEECLNKIDEGTNKKYKSVAYLSKYNNDILHKMIISHDTLLDYAFKIIERHNTLQQILVNKYPYILVDEYQDTHENVVKILKTLADYALNNENKFFVAYFGDTAQNIYDDGVGENIEILHPDLKRIDKTHNRRSTHEVIEVINKIRNDGIKQESIYSDSSCGSVEFYIGSSENIDSFIGQYKQEWSISQDNKLHCFVLTNKLVAKYNGFGNLYEKLSSTKAYSGVNWDRLNTELLSNDTTKLGNVPNTLYRILKFRNDLENPKTPLTTIISQDTYKKLNLEDVDKLLQLLKSIQGTNLQRYFMSMFAIYNETENENYKKIIESLLNIEQELRCDGLNSYLLSELYRDIEESEEEQAKENIRQLLTVNFLEYKKWFDFINKEENEEVVYHTYHGTKGEEYENVIIIMENSFGGDSRKFSNFFTKYGQELDGEEKDKFTKTRNLLYVACSRAIKNLRVLYLDDVTDFQSGIEEIFGELKTL